MAVRYSDADVVCEWGPEGVAALGPVCDVLVIVDVLSFTTCVDVITARGGEVWPYRYRDGTATGFAEHVGAKVAAGRGEGRLSLSPASLLEQPPGLRLVLPSPNGSTLTVLAADNGCMVFAGCLRNATAVANTAAAAGGRVGVVPAGERWNGGDGPLRPGFEDWIGAGAIIAALPANRTRSPLATAAAASFGALHDRLPDALADCPSGLELIDRGFAADVTIASQLDASGGAPRLADGRYTS